MSGIISVHLESKDSSRALGEIASLPTRLVEYLLEHRASCFEGWEAAESASEAFIMRKTVRVSILGGWNDLELRLIEGEEGFALRTRIGDISIDEMRESKATVELRDRAVEGILGVESQLLAYQALSAYYGKERISLDLSSFRDERLELRSDEVLASRVSYLALER
jgi:hypothetical protein